MPEQVNIATIRKNGREEIRLALREFSGHDLFDIRVWAEPYAGDEYIATKKGVCAKVDMLPELIAALQKTEAEARRQGLLGEDVVRDDAPEAA